MKGQGIARISGVRLPALWSASSNLSPSLVGKDPTLMLDQRGTLQPFMPPAVGRSRHAARAEAGRRVTGKREPAASSSRPDLYVLVASPRQGRGGACMPGRNAPGAEGRKHQIPGGQSAGGIVKSASCILVA